MADKKISQLTAATTPLAGTEVLPVVQSGSTVKVAVSDLTAGRAVSTGNLTVSGSATVVNSGGLSRLSIGNTAASTYSSLLLYGGSGKYNWSLATQFNFDNTFEITPSTAAGGTTFNAPAITIDATTGNTALKTGNLIVGTAAKGIDFSANTGAAGMTSELLNWYEEGTWTPTVSGASGTTYTTQNGWYTRVGNIVTVGFELTINSEGTITGGASIAGLPFTSAATYKSSGSLSYAGTAETSTVWQGLVIGASQSVLTIYVKTAASASTTSINGSDFFANGTQLIGQITYRV